MKLISFLQTMAKFNLNADINFIVDKTKTNDTLMIAADSVDVFKQTKVYITVGTKKVKK